jgi:hypothetical protein
MRRLAHALARRALGPAYPHALRRWRRAQASRRGRRSATATRRFVAWHGPRVSGGPFAGLEYPDLAPHSLAPKLLGIYERELHAAVENAIRAEPEVIVNVGAADGYYAVGLARRCPRATVIAYEADPEQRELCARVAAANGADVQIHGAATLADLRAQSRRPALLVMDCEGCERALLEPPLDATIIVELHDVYDPGVGDEVVARFRATHEIELVPTAPQPPGGILSEQRPGPMRWAVMTPRHAPRA